MTQIRNANHNELAAENCWRDILEWLDKVTENLEDTEVPTAANISHDSDPEHPSKVASRKHSIYTHVPKDRTESAISGKRKDSVRGETKCSFRHDEDKRAKSTPKTTPPSEPSTQRGGSASRRKNLRGRSLSGKFARRAKIS